MLIRTHQVYFITFTFKLPTYFAEKLIFKLKLVLLDFDHIFDDSVQEHDLVQLSFLSPILLPVLLKSGGQLQRKAELAKLVSVWLAHRSLLHAKITLLTVSWRDIDPLGALEAMVVFGVRSELLHIGTTASGELLAALTASVRVVLQLDNLEF